MKKLLTNWLYESKARNLWGIPIGIGLFVLFLLVVNLFFVGQEDPNSSVTKTLIQAEISSEDLGLAAPSQEQELPEKPKPELWASRIIETKAGHWKVIPRDLTFKKLKTPHVMAVMRGKRLVLPLASTEPNHFRYQLDGESRLVFSPFDAKGSTDHLSFDRSRKYRYALQITTLDETKSAQALSLAARLTEAGYYAYLYRSGSTRVVGEENLYDYKLRIGYFASERELNNLSATLKAEFKDEPLMQGQFTPVLPNFEEVDQELVDFRVQRNKPWIINLGAFGVLDNALTALTRSGPFFDFLYLSQVQRKDKIIYMLKGGFFSSRSSAYGALEKLRDDTLEGFKGATATQLKYKISSSPDS